MNSQTLPPSGGLPREIGSSFAALNDHLMAQDTQSAPWDDGTRRLYLETGRQALNAIAHELSGRGIRHVFLPGYLCESILEPFVANSMTIGFLPMTDELQIDLRAMESIEGLNSVRACAVVMLRYFGHRRDDRYISQIAMLQSRGNIVIEDLTHSIFDETRSTADYTFASLRKLLPVASGAFVTGLDRSGSGIPARRELVDALWAHMDSKRDYLEGKHLDRSYYEKLVSATSVLEGTFEAHRMDKRSFELLGRLPYMEFSHSRRSNFAALAEKLAGVEDISVLNENNSGVATHLILRSVDSSNLRQRLAEKRIYCPVHWPRPASVPKEVPWKFGFFSIPIDHRYTTEDMMHVGAEIGEILR